MSGRELIERALDDGRIDRPTALLYRVYALSGDPRLPAQFRGDAIAEDNEVFQELAFGGVDLSAEIQAALRPFLVRPDHPESVYSGAMATGVISPDMLSAGARTATLPCIDRGQGGALTTWASARASVPVRIWAGCDAHQDADIELVRQIVDAVWAPMVELMGPFILDAGGPDEGGDEAIDIYLVDWCVVRAGECRPMKAGVIGAALPAPPFTGVPENSSGFVRIARMLMADPAELRRTVVHELFHVLEFAHNSEAGGHPRMGWLYEGNAKWSETYFLKEASPAHRLYAEDFQPFDLSLDASRPLLHQYASYIWFFFAEQEAGAATIDRMWEAVRPATDTIQVLQALERTFSFRDHFRDFAVRNVNDRAALEGSGERTFQAEAGFPTTPPRIQNQVLELPSTTDGPKRQTVDLQRLSADYWHYALPRASGGQQTEQLILDFGGIDRNAELDIDLLVHSRNGWRREQPAGGEIRFCRNVAEDDVDELWIVLTDHDVERPLAGYFTLETRTEPCGVGGSVTIDFSMEHPGPTVNDEHWTITGSIKPRDEVELLEGQPDGTYVGIAQYEGEEPPVFCPPGDDTALPVLPGHGRMWLAANPVPDAGLWDATLAGRPGLLLSAYRVTDELDRPGPPLSVGWIAIPGETHTLREEFSREEFPACADGTIRTITITLGGP